MHAWRCVPGKELHGVEHGGCAGWGRWTDGHQMEREIATRRGWHGYGARGGPLPLSSFHLQSRGGAVADRVTRRPSCLLVHESASFPGANIFRRVCSVPGSRAGHRRLTAAARRARCPLPRADCPPASARRLWRTTHDDDLRAPHPHPPPLPPPSPLKP
ncbi:hypothetical protein CALCODRAFT_280827 [Calocera cornea HHB12733]|uniref:Uncharacterized protein n=1 Tax=Calocera cornea HHB12733 TaxID=1353952 RepID=A0A165JT90_9BASI|nr:hypothetical protein CALCODRAFT_280827 [Calocera cornea HHB12733]